MYWIFLCVCVLSSVCNAFGSTFTFELPDGEKRCFYNSFQTKDSFKGEFQVISGGNYDVDVTLKDPNNKIVREFQREQYHFFDVASTMEGDYELCFSNEFSSYTHKTVFMAWDTPIELLTKEKTDNIAAPLTIMDTTIFTVYENLQKATSYQTKNRVQESSSRSFVEALNDRVTYGSIIQAIVIIVVAVGQVFLLRSLFKEPSSGHYRRHMNPVTAVNSAGY